MNRDDRTPAEITATGSQAGREPAPSKSGSGNGLKNRVPPSGSCRANATVIRYLAPIRHDRARGVKIGRRHLKVTDQIAAKNATVKRPGHSLGVMRTNPVETSLGEQSLGEQNPGKKNLGRTSFPMMFAKTVASAKRTEVFPVESQTQIDSRT
jgi:hypothetical protein